MAAVEGSARIDGPFVGRGGPLRTLLSAIEAAEHGRGTVVLVGGEPGIGKTRLVVEAAERSEHRVLWAQCWDGDGVPAFWPWRQVLRQLTVDNETGASIADLPPDASTTVPTGDVDVDARFRFFDAVAEAVAVAARQRAIVVVLDDLQWADGASVRLLEFLARDPRARRLAIIGTYRDTEVAAEQPLHATIGELACLHLHLDGLAEPDLMSLATALVDDGVELPSAALLRRRSGGNPLFVRELVRLLADERRGEAQNPAEAPMSVRGVVARRLSGLTSSTRETLTIAAVIGADFDLVLLAMVSEQTADELAERVDEARSARLIETWPGSPRCVFVHAVVREVLYESLGLAERARWHARIAEAIERRHRGTRVTEVAHHVLHAASVVGDEQAVDWCVQAAEHSASGLAYEEAAAWYGRALELLPADPGAGREAELLIRRGDALVACGAVPAARDVFRQAAAVARPRGDGHQLARAALGLGAGFGGFEVRLHDQVQIALLEEALDTLGTAASSQRAWVLARLSVALSSMGVDERREALSEEAIAAAREIGDAAALGYALAGHCDVIAGPNWSEQRRDEAAEIVRLAQRTGDRQLELLGRRLGVVAMLELGELGSADHEIAQFAQTADALGQPLYRWYVPLWRGMRALMTGDIDESAQCGALAEEIGRAAHSDNAADLTLTQWWVRQRAAGRFAESAAEMADVLGLVPGRTPAVSGAAGLRLRTVIAVQVGDLAQAAGLVARWRAEGMHERVHDSEWLPETAQLAEVVAIVGARDDAELLFEQLRPYAHRFCVEGIGAAVTGSVSWYLAMVARTIGRIDDADAFEAEARVAHRRIGLVGDPPALAPRPPSTPTVHTPRPARPAAWAAMVHEGATWAVTFDGVTLRLRDSKGLRDIAVLLSRPDQEVHCLELVGGSAVGGDAGPALDIQARRAYEQRIRDLQDDIEEARLHHDPHKAERAEAELDALVHQLSEAFGLSGRPRPTGSASERARTTVTSRIRTAINTARNVHPSFARHLQHAVRTGVWCAYRPEHTIVWDIDAAPDASPHVVRSDPTSSR